MDCHGNGSADSKPGGCGCSCGADASWPFPQLSPGDIHGLFLDYMIRSVTEREEGRASVEANLNRLAASGVLQRDDRSNIARMLAIGHSGDDLPAISRSLRKLHLNMLTSGEASPVALAIVSIGIDSVTHSTGIAGKQGGGIFNADMDGAVEGATIGASAGGVAGAIVGGCIGAAGRSFGKWLSNRDLRAIEPG